MNNKSRYPFKRIGLLTPLSVMLAMAVGSLNLRASPIDDFEQPEPSDPSPSSSG